MCKLIKLLINMKSLQKLGLPASLEKIDGAMRWGYNDKTYFFSGKYVQKQQ